MGYGAYMRELLRPLGVYRLTEGSFSHSETEAIGGALDGAAEVLAAAEQEGQLATAEEALARWASLFLYPPCAADNAALRRAIAALLLIGEGSFTVDAINETLCGCGVSCTVAETEEKGTVRVSFPGTAGVPEGFAQQKRVIEEIIPCHLLIDYFFRFMTWAICEEKEYTWAGVEEESHSWESFSLAVN